MRRAAGRISRSGTLYSSRLSHPFSTSAFLSLHSPPPASAQSRGVYVINDKRGASIYARIRYYPAFHPETMELHQSLPEKIAIFIANVFPPLPHLILIPVSFIIAYIYRPPIRSADKCNFLLTNLRILFGF